MKAYLFDFDGTLVDSMPAYGGAMKKVLDDHGISYGKDLVKTITPLGLKGTAEYFRKIGLDLPLESIIGEIGKNLYYEYANNIQLKPYVADALKTLKEKGCRLNILTAGPHITLDVCIERLGIGWMFENIWSCDDFKTTKTDPGIYKAAAERLGLRPEEVLFLDDNLYADLAAKKAGMKVCGVYDASSAEFENEIRENTDDYLEDFSGICEIISDH